MTEPEKLVLIGKAGEFTGKLIVVLMLSGLLYYISWLLGADNAPLAFASMYFWCRMLSK